MYERSSFCGVRGWGRKSFPKQLRLELTGHAEYVRRVKQEMRLGRNMEDSSYRALWALLSLGVYLEGYGWPLKGFEQDSDDVSVGPTDQTIDKREAGVDTG